jgi:hypothetical protein
MQRMHKRNNWLFAAADDAGDRAAVICSLLGIGRNRNHPRWVSSRSSCRPKASMDVIAQMLARNKDLLLYVVGQTDDTGAGTANLDLSRQRASAVVNKLIKCHVSTRNHRFRS